MKLNPIYIDGYMPEILEEGNLYISERFELAIHLCGCGCKLKTVTPLGITEWQLTNKDNKVSLRPSILNRSCGAHYFITDNIIEHL